MNTVRALFRQIASYFVKPKVSFGWMISSGDPVARHRVHNPQFVSFLQESGFAARAKPDRYELTMRRRRFVAYLFVIAVLAGFSWILIESAQALSLF